MPPTETIKELTLGGQTVQPPPLGAGQIQVRDGVGLDVPAIKAHQPSSGCSSGTTRQPVKCSLPVAVSTPSWVRASRVGPFLGIGESHRQNPPGTCPTARETPARDR